MSLSDHAQIRTHLAAIQTKIRSLESQLALLHAQERTARTTLDNIVYPYHTLPTDVLTEIFQHCTDDPSLLSSVCKQWRDAAFSCPRLWPAIPNPPPSDSRALANLLRSRLSRSGILPFRIDALLPSTGGILSIMAPYFPQLLNLKLCVSAPIAFPRDRIGQALPCLTELSIKRKPHPAHDPLVLPSTPQLRDVRLSNVKVSQISLPWSQLTALSLSHLSLSDGLAVLQRTPSLVTLYVRLGGIHNRAPKIIKLPHLRSLSTSLVAILEAIKAPLLEDLDVQHFSQYTAPVLRNFMARFGCSIHKLRLRAPREGNAGLEYSTEKYSCEWDVLFKGIAARKTLPAVESLVFTDCVIPIRYIATMLAAHQGKQGSNHVFQIHSG